MTRKLNSAREALQQLGMERETSEKQLLYLTGLSTYFQRLVTLSIDAKYGSHEIFQDKHMRLATLISERNMTFSEELALYGQRYHFSTSKGSGQVDEDLPPALSWNVPADDNDESFSPEATFEVRKLTDCGEIEDILHDQESVSVTNVRPIAIWLREVYQSSRGFELGTFDSSILATTMKAQSVKWTDIALGYISDIVAIVHQFIHGVLESICPERLVKFELLSILSDGLSERYQKAIDQVRFLLKVERMGTPMTLNHYFNDNLEKW